MSQPKALDSQNLFFFPPSFQFLRFHSNRNRLEPHLVAISVPASRGRKKFMSEGEKDKYFLQCKAERKWSLVTLESVTSVWVERTLSNRVGFRWLIRGKTSVEEERLLQKKPADFMFSATRTNQFPMFVTICLCKPPCRFNILHTETV